MSIGIAMAVLYGLLAMTSLSVKLFAARIRSTVLPQQINAWWRIFPIISLVLLTYPLGLFFLASLIYLLGVFELAPYYAGARHHIWFGAAVIGIGVSCLWWQAPVMAPMILIGAIILQIAHFILRPRQCTLIWLLLFMTAVAMAMLAAFARLPFSPAIRLAWLFYLFSITALNDIGQFAAGKLFGRQKIAPTISPNKTWQGLAGGLVVTQCVSHTLGNYIRLGPPTALAAYAITLCLGGFTGDLIFSAAKRYLSIKDFSQLIPGHGGILDRVDSLVVTAPLSYWLMSTFA